MSNLNGSNGEPLGGSGTGQFQTWDDNPAGIKVFILAGQSNMVGYGMSEGGNSSVVGGIGSLRYLAVNNASYPDYDYASDDVLIIKTAWGGHSLGGNFRPPSAVAARGGDVGASYLEMIANVREVLSSLGTQFEEWAGMGYQIVGFGWHQGVNDRVAGFNTEYDENLVDLISDVRAEFGKPSLPFVIATTGMGGDLGPPEDYPYTGYSVVEKAQLWVADMTQPANVLSDDTRYYWRDSSVSPTSISYHWNHNAESYFLIGKKMGNNMVNLLTP